MESDMIDPQVIIDKLAGLGNADAIARFLHVENIVGNHCPTTCPVALYVARESGQRIAVTHGDWAVVTRGVLTDPRPLPGPVRRFVALLDSHAYPALITGESAETEWVAEWVAF